MFSNLQIRPAKSPRRKPSLSTRAGISKRRVSRAAASDVPSLSFMESLFGDEFPEAFPTRDIRHVKKKTILDLPTELLSIISDNLGKSDVKRLRLTTKRLAAKVDLHLDRVYISPNRANLECLNEILQHPRYKSKIREIVWDDTLLLKYSNLDRFRQAIDKDDRHTMEMIESIIKIAVGEPDDDSNPEGYNSERSPFDQEDYFQDGRLTELAQSILLRSDNQFARLFLAKNAAQMSIEESFEIYQKMYEEEREIMNQGIDKNLFHRALSSFQNLKRVTLTNEVWRFRNSYPIYDTPHYRSLPQGFRKPFVQAWLSPRSTCAQIAQLGNSAADRLAKELISEWRGYYIIVAALANTKNLQITDFLIDSGKGCFGVDHHLFVRPSPILDNTLGMVRNLPLTRFKFSLDSYEGGDDISECARQANLTLKHLISNMVHLEHLDFSFNSHKRGDEIEGIEHAFHWHEVFPADRIKQVKTITLRNGLTIAEELSSFMQLLATTEHFTFDNIYLVESGNSTLHFSEWKDFFPLLRPHYTNSAHVQPRISLIVPFTGEDGYGTGRCLFMDANIDRYFLEMDLLESSWARNERNPRLEGFSWAVNDLDPEYKVRIRGSLLEQPDDDDESDTSSMDVVHWGDSAAPSIGMMS